MQKVAAQGGFTAQEVRAAGDVQLQPVGWCEPHQRGIAQAPARDLFQQVGIGRRISLFHRDGGKHGAYIGQRHACLQAKPRRSIVYRRQAQRVAVRARDDLWLPAMPRDAVGGQPAQP